MTHHPEITIREWISDHLKYDIPEDPDRISAIDPEELAALVDHLQEVLLIRGIDVLFRGEFLTEERYDSLLLILDNTIPPHHLKDYSWDQVMFTCIFSDGSQPENREVPVRDIVGPQPLIDAANAEPERLRVELERLETLLATHDITLEYFSEIDAAERYRFIMEDVMNASISISDESDEEFHFVYETFNSDHLYMMNLAAENFLSALWKPDRENILPLLSDRVRGAGSGKSFTRDQAYEHLLAQLKNYPMLALSGFTISRAARTSRDTAVVEAEAVWITGYKLFSYIHQEETLYLELKLESVKEEGEEGQQEWNVAAIQSGILAM